MNQEKKDFRIIGEKTLAIITTLYFKINTATTETFEIRT